MNEAPLWQAISATEAAAKLEVVPESGLTTKQREERLAKYGPNTLPVTPPPSVWTLLMRQVKSFIVLVLIGTAVLSVALGELGDAAAILVALLLNVVVGFLMDYGAERDIASLSSIVTPRARVRRDGHEVELSASELLPGDVILLESGDRVPADARIYSGECAIDESLLTGESEAVEKSAEKLGAEPLPLSQRANELFAGSLVRVGSCTALVTTTGPQTELGRIGKLLSATKPPPVPLNLRLATMGQYIVWMVAAVCTLLLVLGLWQGQPFWPLVRTAVVLAVAAIPEGLPSVSTLALAAAARKIEAVYAYPHQNHATMEPMNATARWTPERCEVWTPTQNGEAALAAAAEAAGLPPAKCEVYKLHLGGGFGRRGAVHDWVRQAVEIAKQMPGVPVKLLWSREEDMLHGRYHPVTQCKLTAGLDAQNNITALHMRIAGQSILAGVFPQNIRNGIDPVQFQGLNAGGPEAAIGYTFPNLLVDHAMRNPHVPPGFWRGVNLNQNTVYLECFIDEVAAATRQDPLALRRKLMDKTPKHLAVLNAVAERVKWGTPAPDMNGQKVFRGLAQTHGFGSYVAACAEVSVSAEGELTIHRIVAATDPGYAVNPQQIEAQVEGSFVYGLSAALFGSCTVKDGRIEQDNFSTYPVMHMRHMPKVETIVVASGGFWGGVGEPTIAVAAPAVLNAIFAATGKRIRDLPLKDQSLKRA